MQYILIFVWIGFLALIAKPLQVKRKVLVDGVEEDRYIWVFAFICFLPIIFMAGFRSYNIGDTWAYVNTYKGLPSSLDGIPSYIEEVNKDQGFSVFSIVLKSVFRDNISLYLLTIAFIQGILTINFFRQYSCDYIISLFLFVASIDYFSWMFNGIRQFLAVTIILVAMPFVLKKKYLRAILIILLASTIHQTALIMIPIIFIVQGKAWNKRTMVFIVGIIVILLFIGEFTSWLDTALSDTQYKNVVKDYTAWEDDGTNPLRVLVYSIPAIISFGARKIIRQSEDKVINIATNMSIISAGIYVVSMFTSGIFIGRLPIYCSLFSYLLLPWELKNVFKETMRQHITFAMIVLYLVFYFYQMHIVYSFI